MANCFFPGTDALICPANFYCPGGSTTPRACPPNTESVEGSAEQTACTAVAGYYGQPGELSSIERCWPGSLPEGNIYFATSSTRNATPSEATVLILNCSIFGSLVAGMNVSHIMCGRTHCILAIAFRILRSHALV
jgi:hypothetical protein